MGGEFDPPEGNPGQLENCVQTYSNLGRDAGKQKEAVKGAVALAVSEWNGPRKDDFVHAGAGLQVEISLLETSAKKVSGLVAEYKVALRKAQSDIHDWKHQLHQLEQRAGSGDSADSITAYKQLANERPILEGDARRAKQQLKRLADSIAREIGAETAQLLPGGDKLDPSVIGRKVRGEYGIAGLTDSPTGSDAWKALASAESAVPDDMTTKEGGVKWKELAAWINNHTVSPIASYTAGPGGGVYGWALTRYLRNAREVARVDKTVRTIFDDMVGPMAELYKSGIASMGDVDAMLDAASPVADLERSVAGNPASKTKGLADLLRRGGLPATRFWEGFGRVLAGAGLVADVLTVINPEADGARGWSLRGAAIVNGGLIAADTLGPLLGINALADGIPVVGEVVMVGTGLYLAGDWMYHNVAWFKNGCDAVGHAVSTGVSKAVDGVKHLGSSIGHAISSIF